MADIHWLHGDGTVLDIGARNGCSQVGEEGITGEVVVVFAIAVCVLCDCRRCWVGHGWSDSWKEVDIVSP